ncbi:MAG: S1C family serine protease [Planctomycetaceae bacterium]|nr:S1C family serine protease [Planctomycetaceae bacterium]
MIRFFTLLWVIPLLLGTVHANDPLADAIRESVSRVAPRLVRIDTIGGYEKIAGEFANDGTTTGLLMDAQGHILTSSFNFIHEPSSILVRFHDGVRKIAKVVATDSSRKLTLLKVEVPEKNLALIEPMSQPTLRIGQYVVAVGCALSIEEPNISLGILSGENRIWGKAIQTDAKISPNNYGGPLLNLRGEILGLCVPLSAMSDETTAGADMYDAGVGLVIPVADMLDSFERLKEGKNLESGLLGIGFGELALFVGPATIEEIAKDSPAAKAGLRKGDRIVRIDETAVDSAMDATIQSRRKYAGDTIKITILRGGDSDEIPFEIIIAPR